MEDSKKTKFFPLSKKTWSYVGAGISSALAVVALILGSISLTKKKGPSPEEKEPEAPVQLADKFMDALKRGMDAHYYDNTMYEHAQDFAIKTVYEYKDDHTSDIQEDIVNVKRVGDDVLIHFKRTLVITYANSTRVDEQCRNAFWIPYFDGVGMKYQIQLTERDTTTDEGVTNVTTDNKLFHNYDFNGSGGYKERTENELKNVAKTYAALGKVIDDFAPNYTDFTFAEDGDKLSANYEFRVVQMELGARHDAHVTINEQIENGVIKQGSLRQEDGDLIIDKCTTFDLTPVIGAYSADPTADGYSDNESYVSNKTTGVSMNMETLLTASY